MSSGTPGIPASAASGRGGGGGGSRGGAGRGGRSGRGGRGKGGGRGGGRKGQQQQQAAGNASSTTASEGRGNSAKEGRGGGGRRGRNNRNKNNKDESSANKQTAAEPTDPPQPELPPEQAQAKLEEEKRFQEEARQKAKVEKEAAAAAAAEKEQKAAFREKCHQAVETLQTAVENLTSHEQARKMFEEESLAALRKSFAANKKALKTDLKKCTAFVKKIKSGTAWSMKAADIVKDVATLNLSRYVEEVVTAVVDAKPKVNDVATVVALCQAMHERYPEFLPPLKQQLWQTHIQNTPTDAEATKTRRVFLRIWTELMLRGLLTETKSLVKLIAASTGAPDDKSNKYTVTDPSLVVAFCKQAGVEILGTVPASIREAMEWVKNNEEAAETNDSDATKELIKKGLEMNKTIQPLLSNRSVSDEVSQVLQVHCRGAYQSLADSLLQTHHKLLKLEKRCEQDRLLSGTLTEAREKGLQDARKLKENLFKATESVADVLDEVMPSLDTQNNEDDEAGQGPGIEVLTKGDGEEADTGPFDDEETRAFYCDVPDFISTMPSALLNLSPDAVKAKQEENARKYGDLSGETTTGEEDIAELVPLTEEEMEEQESESALAKDEEEETNKDTPRYKLMVLLEEELPECHRREQIDELAERFCSNHGSSKTSRKRLAKKLFLVPHARLDLLPFYSRMAATLDRVWSDIATPLVTDLEQQFHGQAKFKKNQNLEARMRTARYLGELVKFRVAPPMVFIRCMRRCLEDFTGANVDVACALLESCGRYLYRLSHTHATVTSLMETMTRLSKAKNLDERLQSLLKAAFFSVKPPPSGPKKKAKEYPPLEAYLRFLLMDKLAPSDDSVSEISKELLRFPWSDPTADCGALVCRIMLKACRRGRYKTIKAIASVTANLRSQKGANEAPVRLVDSVLEELRWALEHPNFRDQQRVLTYARLLGELFVITQVSGQVVLDQLFDFIHLGHEIPEALREASKKLAESTNTADLSEQQLPVYNSASGVVKEAAIAEEEEMEMGDLETKKEDVEPKPVAVSAASKYDPRVPSLTDPPNAVYRVKLVCTLLEVSTKQLVTKKNLPRLKAFMADFQRYLFTKPVLPTEVEFALLDTFDAVESQWRRVTKSQADEKENGFPRYQSWLEAHNAAVVEEEAEAALEKKKRLHIEALADPSNSLVDIENLADQEMYEGSQDGSQQGSQLEEEDDDASRSYSLNNEDEGEHDHENEGAEEEGDQKDDDEEDDEEYDEEYEEEFDDDDEEEEFDEEAYMRQMEEEAFERELRRATMEALEKGKNISRKIVAGDMISGSQVIKKKSADRVGGKLDASAVATPPGMFALSGQAGIGFQLLKRGNKGKVEAKEFVVPTDTNLAVVATRNDDAAARERDEIKQRVLQYEAESAEAELTGGNVYLQQESLQVIRNKPLSMDDIDRNFGTTRGDLATSDRPRPAGNSGTATSSGRGPGSGRGHGPGRGGRGRGGRGRSSSGRTLFG